MLCFLLSFAASLVEANLPPHLIYIKLDDVGTGDLSYANSDLKYTTPNIDALAQRGIQIPHYYTSPTCTPSRASFITGRYAHSTGLNFAMFPGSLAGLPLNMTTLPQVLRKHGYRTKMVGKWHLGYSSWDQMPTQHFDCFTGNVLWGLEPFSKKVYDVPWSTIPRDWIQACNRDGELRYDHKEEPRHATKAITEEAMAAVDWFSSEPNSQERLFLYVSYTAPHSPCISEKTYTDCERLPHLWRRRYCNALKEADEYIGRLVRHLGDRLGNDVVLVFSSDNGGSTWFGALNEEKRSGKVSPFNGGINPLAVYVDFRLSPAPWETGLRPENLRGRQYAHLVHVSDWMPTFLSLAQVPSSYVRDLDLDGFDLSQALLENRKVRDQALIELYDSTSFGIPGEDRYTFIQWPWKLIDGVIRDNEWYSESLVDRINSTDTSWRTWMIEESIRLVEGIVGEARAEGSRLYASHLGIYEKKRVTLLFNLEQDPGERRDLSQSQPDKVEELRRFRGFYESRKGPVNKWWETVDLENFWPSTFVKGSCQDPNDECLFLHPYMKSSFEDGLTTVTTTNGVDFTEAIVARIRNTLVIALSLMIILCIACCRKRI